jgi:hypothetical protein
LIPDNPQGVVVTQPDPLPNEIVEQIEETVQHFVEEILDDPEENVVEVGAEGDEIIDLDDYRGKPARDEPFVEPTAAVPVVELDPGAEALGDDERDEER